MALFENANQFLELFLGGNPEEEHLANQANLSGTDFSKIAAVGLPLIMNAINQNTQTDEGLESFNNALDQHEDTSTLNSHTELINRVDKQDGDKILGHVLGKQQDTIIDRVADALGMEPEEVRRALTLIAPLVLKYVADRRRANNLDSLGVQQEVNATYEQISRSLDQKQSSGGLLSRIKDLFLN